MPVPYWVQDSIFYQIFPDRFANGDKSNDPPNVQKWGAKPNIWDFQGGDVRGIIRKFDYLLELGINAIYLNPIFQATSSHRYNTSDYYKIDPKLGDMVDFDALLDVAHRNNVRVILDGVFNHCGRGFFAFNDLLENGEHSAYANWFHIHRFPLDAFTPGEALNYAGWWSHKSLPKFNTTNPDVQKYLLGIARYWIERGADGWRLDVPNEINDDDFWGEFRREVKDANREAYIFGEIWDADPRWANDAHFDGLMNYPVKDALIKLLTGRENLIQFSDKVEGLFKIYPRENMYAMYVPLGSHDTERILTALGGNLDKLKLAFLFQFAYPGAPAIYYGDEVGLEGGKDPECRGAFPWDPTHWKGDLQPWVRELIAVRKDRVSLRRGEFSRILINSEKGIYAFSRTLGEEKTLAAFNFGQEKQDLQIPVKPLKLQDGTSLRSLFDHRPFTIIKGNIHVTLPPYNGIYIG
jgi:cyclomaltodextrinase / maltogenic alpha-amylase / neopullulanase